MPAARAIPALPRPDRSNVEVAFLACALSLAVGAAATSGQGRLAVAAVAGGIGALALWRWNVGVLIGVLLLAQLGALGNHPSKAAETGFLTVEVLRL